MKQFKFMFFLLMAFALSVVAPPVQADVGCDQQTELYAQAVNNTAPQAEAPQAVQNPEAPTPVVTVSDNVAPVSTFPPEPELPPEGSPLMTYVWWLVGIIGVSNILRIIFRLIPTSINIDWQGKILQIINIILGAWIPNLSNDGGEHKREYSLPRKA